MQGLRSVVAAREDAEQIQEQVVDVEVQAHRHIHGVVSGGSDFGCPPHVIADVEGEDARCHVVHDAQALERGNEQLQDAHSKQAEKGHEQCAADLAVELREQKARDSHHARDQSSCHGGLAHDTGIGDVVVGEHRSEHGTKRHHDHIEPDERDQGIVAGRADENPDDGDHETDQEKNPDIGLPGGSFLGDQVGEAKAPGQHQAEEAIEAAAGHGITTMVFPDVTLNHSL